MIVREEREAVPVTASAIAPTASVLDDGEQEEIVTPDRTNVFEAVPSSIIAFGSEEE